MIYFIETQGMVKIGHSNDPAKRLTILATGCPSICTLIGVTEGGKSEEAALHELFKDLRANGEWFRFEQPINDYLRDHAISAPDLKSFSKKPPKNAPARWDEISEAAKALGAGAWAMRKWLARAEIPAAWKIKILSYTDNAISLDDMAIQPSIHGELQ